MAYLLFMGSCWEVNKIPIPFKDFLRVVKFKSATLYFLIVWVDNVLEFPSSWWEIIPTPHYNLPIY